MTHPILMRDMDLRRPYAYRTLLTLPTVASDTSTTQKLTIGDEDFICTRARVSGFYLASGKARRIVPTDAATDITRIKFRGTGGQKDFFSEPVDLQAFNEQFGDEFAGLFMPSKTEFIVEVTNTILTASNYAAPATFEVAFFGYHKIVRPQQR